MSTPVSRAPNFKHYCTISTAVYQISDLVLEFRAKTNWPITMCLCAYNARIYVSLWSIFRDTEKKYRCSNTSGCVFIHMCSTERQTHGHYSVKMCTRTHTHRHVDIKKMSLLRTELLSSLNFFLVKIFDLKIFPVKRELSEEMKWIKKTHENPLLEMWRCYLSLFSLVVRRIRFVILVKMVQLIHFNQFAKEEKNI